VVYNLQLMEELYNSKIPDGGDGNGGEGNCADGDGGGGDDN